MEAVRLKEKVRNEDWMMGELQRTQQLKRSTVFTRKSLLGCVVLPWPLESTLTTETINPHFPQPRDASRSCQQERRTACLMLITSLLDEGNPLTWMSDRLLVTSSPRTSGLYFCANWREEQGRVQNFYEWFSQPRFSVKLTSQVPI